MRGSRGAAKPLLSQCLEKVWHLELYKLVGLVAVSFANSGVKAIKGCFNAVAERSESSFKFWFSVWCVTAVSHQRAVIWLCLGQR